MDRREEALLSIIPRERRRIYKPRRMIEPVMDKGSVVDMGGRPANQSDMSPAPGTEKLEAVLDAVFTNRARGAC